VPSVAAWHDPFYGVERRIPCRRILPSTNHVDTRRQVLTLRQNSVRWLVAFVPALLLTGAVRAARRVGSRRALHAAERRSRKQSQPGVAGRRISACDRPGARHLGDRHPGLGSCQSDGISNRAAGNSWARNTDSSWTASFDTVQADDSPDITGEYCFQADSIAASDSARISAETAFAAAGRATHSHDWNAAFEDT